MWCDILGIREISATPFLKIILSIIIKIGSFRILFQLDYITPDRIVFNFISFNCYIILCNFFLPQIIGLTSRLTPLCIRPRILHFSQSILVLYSMYQSTIVPEKHGSAYRPWNKWRKSKRIAVLTQTTHLLIYFKKKKLSSRVIKLKIKRETPKGDTIALHLRYTIKINCRNLISIRCIIKPAFFFFFFFFFLSFYFFIIM